MTALLASLEPGGALARVLGSYENRPGQRSMATAVAEALAVERPLLVEAGTGTGKTLAYLIPAAASGKRVVISTGTRALQEQLATKDIELLRQVAGSGVRVAVLKGVSNYVCRRRLAQESTREHDADLLQILPWIGRTETGDRAELDGVPETAEAWQRITTAADGRLGSECPHIDRCFVAAARRRAESAELIIVNHHLFFTDFALRRRRPGARVLPDYDAVIFDEAHQLEDVIASQLGPSISSRAVAALVADLRRPERGWLEARALEWMETCAARFFDALDARIPEDPRGGRLEVPEHLFRDDALAEGWLRLDAALEDVARAADLRAEASGEDAALAASMHAAAQRADGFREALADIAEPTRPACGQWLERETARHGDTVGRSLRLCAAPASAAEIIAEVIAETPAAVFTSATLTTEGSFSFARERLGLGRELADELGLDSPFDYGEQALLYVPRDLPEPSEPGFAVAASARIGELLEMTVGGAFVLFTSWRALERTRAMLRAEPIAGARPVLVQGEAPKAALLDQFRRHGRAVLLGTASFWQGVDVVGDALSLVIIDKLPFTVPSDPLHRARCKQLEERGIDSFEAYQLPAAALQLKQGFGRLIRSRSDRGVAAVLDRRLVSRRYGRVLLDSLPLRLPRTSVLEQVRRFWSRGG